MNFGRILLIKFGAIGDCLLTTPLVRALRKNFPTSHIAYLTFKKSAPALEGNPNINEIIVFEEKHYFPKMTNLLKYMLQRKILKELKARKFEVVVDMESSYKSYYLSTFAGIKHKIGFALSGRRSYLNFLYQQKIESKEPIYQVERYLKLIDAVGAKRDGISTEFFVNKTAEQRMKEFLNSAGIKSKDTLIGINPATSAITKRWPKEYYIALAKELVKTGVKVMVVWGADEYEYVKEFSRKEGVLVAPPTNFHELGALIKRCSLFISNDAAPLHLAVALDVPSIGFYGSTDYRVWAISNNPKHIALHKELSCSPCDDFSYCKTKKHECMYSVSEERVFKEAKKFILQ